MEQKLEELEKVNSQFLFPDSNKPLITLQPEGTQYDPSPEDEHNEAQEHLPQDQLGQM